MKVLGIIPARYSSTRFPGKPLVYIKGKMMIERVYERSLEAFDDLIVATDDDRIADAVRKFNGNCVLTSKKHKSGTDRCAEAMLKYEKSSGKKFDVIINIQGDEPFIDTEDLLKVISNFKKKETQISTLVKEISKNEDIFNPEKPKVLINNDKFAIYFSRSAIPYLRGIEKEDWHKNHKFYKHIGIYGYKSEILEEISRLIPSSLEIAESLEQNRWIENGYKISVEFTNKDSISVDTPEDLKLIETNFSKFAET